MATMPEVVEIGSVYEVRVDAKGAMDEGIGKVGEFVVFIKNAKTRIGNLYKVKITKLYRTFAYAEVLDSSGKSVRDAGIIFA